MPADADQCTITPLHRACALGLPKMARLLLSHGANPNAQDTNARTPLHYACTDYSSAKADELADMLDARKLCIRLLRRAGADPGLADKNGKTPVDVIADTPASTVYAKFMDSKQLLWYLSPDAVLGGDPFEGDDEHEDSKSCCASCLIL
jgi:ankyrin repeat protein